LDTSVDPDLLQLSIGLPLRQKFCQSERTHLAKYVRVAGLAESVTAPPVDVLPVEEHDDPL
jgi:hypothetical protein